MSGLRAQLEHTQGSNMGKKTLKWSAEGSFEKEINCCKAR